MSKTAWILRLPYRQYLQISKRDKVGLLHYTSQSTMQRYPQTYIPFIIALLLLNSGCELGSSDDRHPAVYGEVMDENGTPLSDVDIHVRLHFSPPEAMPIEDQWARSFRLSIPQTDSVQVEVLRYGTQETVLTLLEGYTQAGQYILGISPYTLTTGLYDLHFSMGDSTLIQTIPVHASNDYLAQTEAFIRSNTQGAFSLDYAMIGIDRVVTRLPLNATSPTAIVLPEITLVAIKDGFVTQEREFAIDEDELIDVTFTLERSPGN